jgi:hypothetical protein
VVILSVFLLLSMTSLLLPLSLIGLGLTLGVAGVYVGESDDAPGAALLGLVLMIGAVAYGLKRLRERRHVPH